MEQQEGTAREGWREREIRRINMIVQCPCCEDEFDLDNLDENLSCPNGCGVGG